MVLNPSVLVEGAEAVLVLPAKTRYEQKGGGTLTTNERKICFTPEIPGHPIGDSLPAWEIPTIIGRRSMPNGELLFPFNDIQSVREEMARVVPIYQESRHSRMKVIIFSGVDLNCSRAEPFAACRVSARSFPRSSRRIMQPSRIAIRLSRRATRTRRRRRLSRSRND